jgi:hypothetical protein
MIVNQGAKSRDLIAIEAQEADIKDKRPTQEKI